MIITTEKAEAKIEALFAHIDSFGADVTLQNTVTGEEVKMDAAALFAGMQAGLVMASEIVKMRNPDESDYERFVVSGIRTAGKCFVRRIEKKWDAKAAEVAEHLKSEGQEDA